MRPATSAVATRAGHRLHVEVWTPARATAADDDRPDVLLVHGLSSNLRLWDGVAAGMCDEGHRVVAVDQRGHGRSERPTDGAFGFDAVCDDLVDVVDACGLERPVVVGQSWGGNVVLELGARAADRIGGVACVDGGFLDLGARFGDVDAAWEVLAPPPFDGVRLEDVEARMRSHTEGWPDAALPAQLANLVRRPDGTIEPALRRDDHRAVVAAMVAQRPLEVAARVGVPVLLLPATTAAEPPAEQAVAVDRLAAALDDCTVAWCRDSDHDVHAQHPALVVAHLRSWLHAVR